MKKIEITPFNDEMDVWLQAIDIVNEYKFIGFTSRSGFIGVVQENLEGYANYKNVKRLLNFWAGRVKCDVMNTEMRNLLIKLKNE